jgi:hypothetical protein
MNREDAVAVLRKIMASCGSFVTAQGVSLIHDKETKSWSLSVFWCPLPEEQGCLSKILLEYGIEATIVNGHTFFHSLQKS